MRRSIVVLACLTLSTSPLFVRQAHANTMSTYNNSPSYNTRNYDTTSDSVAGPLMGDHYIVNPTELTATRDNRGSIVVTTNCSSDDYRNNQHRNNGHWDKSNSMQNRNGSYGTPR